MNGIRARISAARSSCFRSSPVKSVPACEASSPFRETCTTPSTSPPERTTGTDMIFWIGICSWLRSSSSPASSLTASNRLRCFTRVKAFDRSGVRVAAVRAATADPVSGSTPADRSSGGKINRRLPFSNLSSATSLRRTCRACASFKQTRSELGDSETILSKSLTLALAVLAAKA